MKKVIVTILVVVMLVLGLVAAGVVGFLWYRDNHVFVEGTAYPIDSQSLDLREEDISIAYYVELQAKLPNCEIAWNVPFQNGKYPNDSTSLSVKSLTKEDVALLKYFPDLEKLDATACQDYEVLEFLKEQRPELEVVYYISLGGKSFAPDTTELVLEKEDYDLAVLTENLKYLPKVTAITLKMPDLSLEQVDALRSAYETISITCTVDLLGQEYDAETTELDLSAMTSDGVAEVIEKLKMLPNLTNMELMNPEGSSQLTKEDVKLLQEAAPEVVINYSFDFYGVTVSTADEEVVVKNVKIGDENEADVRATLDILTNCSRFVLDNCKLSDEVMAQIREDYRDKTKVVWRVYFGGGSTLTDVDVIRCTYDLQDDNCHDLVYCEDVRFVDFGHNEWLDACDFVAGMTNLEYCIISGAPIKDLTPFANCKKLKLLEIAFCEYIEDLSPLAGCESLQMLNIGNTHALDLSPLDDLPLTHMCARVYPSGVSRVPKEEQERFVEQHPDCWATFSGAQPYGDGWRYDEDGITPLPQYSLMAEAFRYPNAPNNVGWYFDESETE